MSIKIDTDVPLPTVARGERPSKYPFADLEVNQSFFVAGVGANTIHSSVARFVKSHGDGKKFTIRTTREKTEDSPEVEVEGVRVWRTA